MSEPETPPISEPPPSNHYRIRKEVVALCVAAMVGWVVYQVHDWWTHLNWPPHDGRNKHHLSSISCDFQKYLLYKKDIPSISSIGGFSGVFDRQMFVEQPSCLAALYLRNEGAGVRAQYLIFDRSTQKRLATIEMTHTTLPEGEMK